MAQVVVENERLRLALIPSLGAGIGDLLVRAPSGEFVPLWRRAAPGVSWWNDMSCYALAPWCNRIAGGVFRFRGRGVELPADWPDGTAIHGLVKDKPFELLDRSPVSARFSFDSRRHGSGDAVRAWPWAFTCTLRYELEESALRLGIAVNNLGDSPMPCGVGFHPYFCRRLWSPEDDAVVGMNVAGRYPCADMIPSGAACPDVLTERFAEGAPLGTLELDDVFGGSDGRMSVTWPACGVRATFECSPEFGHAVVYSTLDGGGPGARPSRHFCLEPVSMVNDGFNLFERGWTGTGVRVLEPGESMRGTVRLVIEPAPA